MTTRAQVAVSAPGKMMLAGEYAVLEGAEAVVVAVDRRAYAQLTPGSQDELPPKEAAAARAAAERHLGRPTQGALSIDAAELQQEGHKLGLGSSAAGAAAAAAVVYAAHGHSLDDAKVRDAILGAALEGHRAVAPHGSGADVAAAVHGGFVRFRKLGNGVEAHPLVWPAQLELVVLWSGQSARTSDMLGKVRELASHQPALYRARMHTLADQAEQLVSALVGGDCEAAIECFHSYGSAMDELGTAAGIPIVEDSCSRIRELARKHDGAAKPSGAGGGDVTFGVFSRPEQAKAFRANCVEAGFEVLSVDFGAPGARREEAW
jgi:phosphomevalonate kinase